MSEVIGPLAQALATYDVLADIPILPEFAQRLEADLLTKSIHGTAAIEGNPLNEEQVGQILAGTGSPQEADAPQKEIRNLEECYKYLSALRPEQGPFRVTEEFIRETHAKITKGMDYKLNEPGMYRNHRVEVGDNRHGGVYVPPKILPDIKTLMKVFTEWINSPEVMDEVPLIRAALAHYHLCLIHPFGDGNGRTSRFLEAVILAPAGFKYLPKLLSNFYYRKVDDYYWAFSNSLKNKDNDVTSFVVFYLKCVQFSLQEIRNTITFYVRKFALRDFFRSLRKDRAVTRRQFDLLNSLLDSLPVFTLKDLMLKAPYKFLYEKFSEHTARRDVKKLLEMDLLTEAEKTYRLNEKVLG